MLSSFLRLMRSMDSSTAVASAWFSSPTSLPVSTSPVTSEERSTLVGRTVASIMYEGAMELPPESELSEPISASRSPSAPAE
jgi:hypothetical protein